MSISTETELEPGGYVHQAVVTPTGIYAGMALVDPTAGNPYACRSERRSGPDASERAPGAKHLHAALVAWLQRHDKAQREKGIPTEEALYAVVKRSGRGAGLYHALPLRRDAGEGCVPVSDAAACGQRLTREWRLVGRQESVTCDRCLWHMSNVCVGHIEFD